AIRHVDHLVERGRRPREACGELWGLRGGGRDSHGEGGERGQNGETVTVPVLGSHGGSSRGHRGPAVAEGRAGTLPFSCCSRRRPATKLFRSRGIMRSARRRRHVGPVGGGALTPCRHPSRGRRLTSSARPSRRTCARAAGAGAW